MSIRFFWAEFDALAVTELYALLRLRAEVFVVEQHCPFVDPDGLDPDAWHLLAWDRELLVGCARIFPPPDSGDAGALGSGSASRAPGVVSVGRIVTAPGCRGTGLGRELMQEALRWINSRYPRNPVRLGAQARLRDFYEGFGFSACGAAYLEDGIAHLPMEKRV